MIPRTPDDALAALAALGEQPDSRFDLTAAALCCAIHDAPDTDPTEALAVLEEITACARAEEPKSAEALAMVCYGRFGLHGALDDFEDPRNASLLDILVHRKGLPVGLGIVWRHVAALSGARLAGTNTPGRFLMRLDGPDALSGDGFDLIDVFEGGALVSEEAVSRLALQAGEALNPKALRPVPDRVMAVRLQTNIAMRARADARLDEWERAAHRRALLCPWDGRLHLDHAEAAAALDQLGTARAAARKATLDPRPETAEAAQALLDRLTRRLN
jgi:regulator of sirC expression with transglutaminase-like and TPR domain